MYRNATGQINTDNNRAHYHRVLLLVLDIFRDAQIIQKPCGFDYFTLVIAEFRVLFIIGIQVVGRLHGRVIAVFRWLVVHEFVPPRINWPGVGSRCDFIIFHLVRDRLDELWVLIRFLFSNIMAVSLTTIRYGSMNYKIRVFMLLGPSREISCFYNID